MGELAGRRVLVVGASSGIGRATALVLSQEGARVALAGRREQRLREAVAQATSEAFAIAGDVREPEACQRLVERAVAALGGLDGLVYAAGSLVLAPLEEADAETWRRILETNAVGAALVTRAALPHLRSAAGRCVYVSSIAASEDPPRPGMGVYIASKAALDKLVACWRVEHPEVGFTSLVVGDTSTEAGRDLSREAIDRYFPIWQQRGYVYGRTLRAERVAAQIRDLLVSDERIPTLTLVPQRASERRG